jgi:predicted porin
LSEATQNGRVVSLNANYEAGPLYVGVAAEKVYKGLYHDQGIYNTGVSYDLGVVKIMGYYAHTQYARSPTNAAGTASATTCPIASTTAANCFLGTNPGVYNRTSANVWEIGALTPIGGGNLKTGYIRVNPKGGDNLIQKFGIGYDYFLSKRTRVYADAGYAKEDRQTNNKIIALGMRHDF